ncbi:MAG TPA: phospholipase D-like domain-containing protein, partial [Candidatus Competibacteraceae bacterium]|nr:phospholipase D-like domain-containing protein [Candidatus Competibacteraceae bacterium]
MKARGSTGPRPLQWQPRRNCWCLAQANKAAFLIEGAAYFAAFREALQRARHSIFILGWDIDSRVKLSREATPDDLPLELGPFLDAVVRRQPGLQAYVLTWDFAALYMTEREALTRYRLQWRTHHRLHFRMDSAHPLGGSHHQKIVVIDDTVAFVGGLDLTQRRWDTPAHIPDDSRRRDPGGEPYSPFHDVQIMVAGAAAAALGTLARRRWQRAGGQCVGPKPSDSDPWPATVKPDLENVEVAIARTEPAYRGQRAIREIEQLYLDAITAARDSIYLENQYLTSTTITAALCRRLEEATGPEVLLVLPSYASDWLEQATLDSQRAHRLRQLRQADRFGRLRCYFPQGPGLDEAGVYVHAKVMIVDDNLVRIGSANLSNRSMGLDTECDLAIAADHNTRVRQAILAFRHRLLGQHLGVAPEQVAQQIASHGSLLAAVDSLRRPPHTLQPLPESWLE